MPPHNDLTAAKRESFIALLYEGRSVSFACEAVGLARSFVYDLKDRDAEFRKDWTDAQLLGHKHRCDKIEDTMFQRAMEGFVEETKRNGKVIKSVTKVDNGLLIELARGHMPEKYRQNHKVQGEVGLSEDLKRVIEAVQASPTSSIDSLLKS